VKKAFVILGYESSGSVFTAKVISHVLGKCRHFGQWHGYGFNGQPGDDIVILHRSIPFMRPKLWHDEPAEIFNIFEGYEVRFVICTRDLTISQRSRVKRFGGTEEDYQADSQRATELFLKIIDKHDCYVFSYETMVALGLGYFKILYKWLNVESEFSPKIEDGNSPYL
jgi:hypothetical protein